MPVGGNRPLGLSRLHRPPSSLTVEPRSAWARGGYPALRLQRFKVRTVFSGPTPKTQDPRLNAQRPTPKAQRLIGPTQTRRSTIMYGP